MFRILTIVALFVLFGCNEKVKTEEKTTSTTTKIEEKNQSAIAKTDKKENENLPIFTLNTVDGKQLHISQRENGLVFEELKDRAIFLIFFGYRCPPCIREIPTLIELTNEHKDLAIVAMEVQGYNNEELKAFALRKNINYNLISSDGNMDFISYIQTRANWHGSIPFLLGLKRDGEVSIVHTGGVGKSALEGAYRDLVNIK
jgi:thiol-disulfide isomerase/thioredoxin